MLNFLIFYIRNNNKMTNTKRKNLTFISNDLKINRGMVVKLKTINMNEPDVIEINMSCFAIPNETLEIEVYEESISSINKFCNKAFTSYLKKNSSFLSNKFIFDFNFTSANLKKGYNKAVTLSVYVKQKNELKLTKLKNEIRNTIKDTVREITDKIREEKFSCYKVKRK